MASVCYTSHDIHRESK